MSVEIPEQLRAPESPSRAAGGTRRVLRDRLGALTWRRLLAAGLFVAALLMVLIAAKAVVAYRSYHDAVAQIRSLQAYQDRDLGSLSSSDVAALNEECRDLRATLRRLDWATSFPMTGAIIGALPVVGPRYEAGRTLIEVGALYADAGVIATDVAHDALVAYDVTGAFADQAPATETWLDVIARRQDDIVAASTQVARAQYLRSHLDDDDLPARGRGYLDELDRALERFDIQRLVEHDLPAALTALGADQPARYVVLFQNPTELRPSGGFPGTMAYVVIERGQVRLYEIYDIRVVSDDYLAKQLTPYPQPWAIQEFFPSAELIFHDAAWWADFPRSGEQIARMWSETGRSELTGVVAVQPEVISALLRFTGPLVVEFDGERREVTPENVLDEIERQRRLRREGIVPDENHKELLVLIGTHIIETLKGADRGEIRAIAESLRVEADRRNMQMWMQDDSLQAWADERHWSGRIVPDPEMPTLGIVLANVVTNKASLRMLPSASVHIGPVENGRRSVTVELSYQHTGTNEEDPFYAGFQRWWTELYLPSGSERVSSRPDPMPDPESPNGGSYLIAIFPNEVGYLSVTFTMPDAPQILLRRQPGLVPMQYAIYRAGCDEPQRFVLGSDVTIELAGGCH